jgi:preprotein translocase SecE subunit
MANGIAAKSAGKAKDGLFKRLSRFIRESWVEVVKKASWPSREELQKMTAVVILAVLVTAIYIGIVDYTLGRITNPLLGIGVK